MARFSVIHPLRIVSNIQSAPTLLHELWFGLESKSSVEWQGSCYALHLILNPYFYVRCMSVLPTCILVYHVRAEERVGAPGTRDTDIMSCCEGVGIEHGSTGRIDRRSALLSSCSPPLPQSLLSKF